MKQLLNGLMLSLLFAVVATSCKKDEHQVYFEGGTAPVISASIADSITLLQDNADMEVLKVMWTNPDYMFNTGVNSQDVTYTLELDTTGANFASGVKKTYSIVNDLGKTFTASDLNAVLVNSMGLAVNVAHKIEMRVSSNINKTAPTSLVSNVISLAITPYDQPISLSYLYVPGNYQGWAPSAAPQLGATDTKNFEGYVYFSEANTEFKITNEPDWNGTNYGDGGTGAIDAAGGNLKLPGAAGTYLMKVDLPALSWSVAKTDWSIIGAATPGGWDAGTPLTYNSDTKMLEIASIALGADEFKFRANDAWDINLGVDAAGGSFLSYGGGNLKVPAAGNYKVALDLSHPLQYTYTLTKL